MSGERSSTVDKYLEAIFYIAAEGDVVRPSRLAHWLDVRPPTVTNALARLLRDGWIDSHDDRSVTLTDKGVDTASALVRRHRILERWLTQVLGFDWASADDEAERLSSSISDELIDRIDASLNFPSTCPHGNVIPGRRAPYGDLWPLSVQLPGAVVRIRRVSEVAEHEARELLSTLADLHLSEGTVVTVGERPATNDLQLGVDGCPRTVPAAAAAVVWVEPVAAWRHPQSGGVV